MTRKWLIWLQQYLETQHDFFALLQWYLAYEIAQPSWIHLAIRTTVLKSFALVLRSLSYGKLKPQFPQVWMIEQNIFLESTGLEVVSHILVRRRSGCGISWLFVRFLVPLQTLFSKTKDCDTNTKSLLVLPGRCSLGNINPHLFWKVGNCFEETWYISLLLSCPCPGCIWESSDIFW